MNNKIIFVVKNLDIGGMQKALVVFANYLSEKYDVSIYSIEGSGDFENNLKGSIKVIYGNERVANYVRLMGTNKDQLRNNFRSYLKKGLYRYLQKMKLGSLINNNIINEIDFSSKYDIAISYTGYPGIWDKMVLSKIQAKKKLVWIHNDPFKLGIDKLDANKYYNEFDGIINVSLDCKKKFDEIAKNLIQKSHLMYNMIDEDELINKAVLEIPYEKGKFIISTVARLQNSSKRFDRIIACCEMLIREGYTNFEWHIVGGGPDINWLKEEISSRGVERYIVVHGLKMNPYPYIKQSNLFVLASDYEGYGITIREAQILKTPVVVTNFDCANETIKNGYNGIIVEKNEESLFNAIVLMMENKYEYNRIKSNTGNVNVAPLNLNEIFNNIIGSLKYEK